MKYVIVGDKPVYEQFKNVIVGGFFQLASEAWKDVTFVKILGNNGLSYGLNLNTSQAISIDPPADVVMYEQVNPLVLKRLEK